MGSKGPTIDVPWETGKPSIPPIAKPVERILKSDDVTLRRKIRFNISILGAVEKEYFVGTASGFLKFCLCRLKTGE